jgi:hypothetical protein
MYSLPDVVVFFLLILLLAYWWRVSEQKTFAIRQAKEYCRVRKLQLLDQTLVFKKMQFQRFQHQLKLCRIYEFDFSINGQDRFKGEILLSGFNFVRVILEMDELEITEY